MNIQELRFNNWVLNGFGEPIQIKEIISEGNTSGYKVSTLQPIELTPEILEKAGFELELRGKAEDFDGIEKVYHKSGVDIFDNSDNQGDPCFLYATYTRYPGRGFKGGTQVKYVHTLQNLIYALTHQELNINL